MIESVISEIKRAIDRTSPVPLYFQVAGELERAISDGRLPKGDFLGNEIDLADRWQISRPTVRRAIQELVEQGLLVRQRGVGTQVVSDRIRRRVTLMSLHDDLAAQGRAPTTTVLIHEVVVADAGIAESLNLQPGAEVVHIERCRTVDGRRLAILRNWITLDAAGDITAAQLGDAGLYALLRARGVRPHSADLQIGARTATATDAALLDLPVGAPVLTTQRVMQDNTGRPVEVGNHVYDAASYTIETSVLSG
jgi:GntR family transcriptional regulator